jgi:hypothetical protein
MMGKEKHTVNFSHSHVDNVTLHDISSIYVWTDLCVQALRKSVGSILPLLHQRTGSACARGKCQALLIFGILLMQHNTKYCFSLYTMSCRILSSYISVVIIYFLKAGKVVKAVPANTENSDVIVPLLTKTSDDFDLTNDNFDTVIDHMLEKNSFFCHVASRRHTLHTGQQHITDYFTSLS